eukprot:7388425-Pyramimonas_sp.AAC.1
MAASLGVVPILISSAIVIAVSCCDRAQQSCAPVNCYIVASVGGWLVAGMSSGIPVSPAEGDVGTGGGVGTVADATDTAVESGN